MHERQFKCGRCGKERTTLGGSSSLFSECEECGIKMTLTHIDGMLINHG